MTVRESYIVLRKIRMHAFHVVQEQERIVGNDYELSLRIAYPIGKAAQTDNVADTLNYAAVYDVVREEMKTPSRLLEHVATRICRRLMTSFEGIQSVSLSLVKLNPPMGADCDGAGVEVVMNKE